MFAAPTDDRPSSDVSWLFDEGRVVLDLDNDPVKDYKDIPLTLSSQVEGALMEAISRLDADIKIYDFWARLSVYSFRAKIQQLLISDRPRHCGRGGILTPQALSKRMGEFRLANAVTSRGTRLGSKILRDFLWNRMSQAARDQNSTRELNKLSKVDQEEAKQGNAGKHAANAGGWTKKKSQNQADENVLAQTIAEEEGATIPAVLRFRKNRRSREIPRSNMTGNEQRQDSFNAPEEGEPSNPNKRRKVGEPTPGGTCVPQFSFPVTVYQETWRDPSFYPPVAPHGFDQPFNPFIGQYNALPTEVAALAPSGYPQSHPVPNVWNPFAGLDSGRQFMGSLASSWHNSQHMLPAAQVRRNHSTVGAENTLDNAIDLFDPRYIDPSLLQTIQHQNTHQSIGDDSSANLASPDRSFADHVEALSSGTDLRNLVYQTRPMEDQASMEIDYRTIRPQDEEDRSEIQRALVLTEVNYWLRTGNDCPPTDTRQSYSYQVTQILDNFAIWWAVVVDPFSPTPDLVKCHAPWRNGFTDWDVPTGGDQELVNKNFPVWKAAHGG